MKRLATLLFLTIPSAALAHPGHEHAGMSESHHLSPWLMVGALLVVGATFAAYRTIKNARHDD